MEKKVANASPCLTSPPHFLKSFYFFFNFIYFLKILHPKKYKLKTSNLSLHSVVQESRMTTARMTEEEIAQFIAQLPEYDGSGECFTCGARMEEEEVEENTDWCEKCRKKNWWRCFECDEIQKNRKYCEDNYGNTCCKDCRKGLKKDDYHF